MKQQLLLKVLSDRKKYPCVISDFFFFFKIQLTFMSVFDKPQSTSVNRCSKSTYLSLIFFFFKGANKLKIKMSSGIIQHICSHEGVTSFATLLYRSDVLAMLIISNAINSVKSCGLQEVTLDCLCSCSYQWLLYWS